MLEEDIEGPLPFKGCIVEFTPAVGNRSGHTVAKHARVLQDRVHPSAIAERQAQMLQEATGRPRRPQGDPGGHGEAPGGHGGTLGGHGEAPG